MQERGLGFTALSDFRVWFHVWDGVVVAMFMRAATILLPLACR
jgi:hypothetical protein